MEAARRLVAAFVEEYDGRRLHSALGYVTPADRLAGRHEAIYRERERKLAEARQRRATQRIDLPAINTILAKYEDGGFQFADACLMHLAEREGIETIFTLDRRDFGTYRRPSGEPLRLLP